MIKMTTTEREITQILSQINTIVADEIRYALSHLGETCVKRIKERSPQESWIDNTGNLRSSIGYAIYNHGKKELVSAFQVVGQGVDGPNAAESYVNSLASDYAATYALVVVAGMSYAEYVEAIKGKDVLASTRIWAFSKVDQYMELARSRAEKRINQLLS